MAVLLHNDIPQCQQEAFIGFFFVEVVVLGLYYHAGAPLAVYGYFFDIQQCFWKKDYAHVGIANLTFLLKSQNVSRDFVSG